MNDIYACEVDGPNADNPAAADGTYEAFHRFGEVMVIVDATAVNFEKTPLGSRNIALSREAHLLHTARIAGLLARKKAKARVYMGLDIADTAITSPIPHAAHTRHKDYDIKNDGEHGSLGMRAIAGNFSKALERMRNCSGTIHGVVGGPFSSVAKALMDEQIVSKFGLLACQAGFAFSERAIYSKMSFNLEVDLRAALEVFLLYPQEVFYVPSDITRDPAVTFKGAEELGEIGVSGEIYEIFLEHRKKTQERHDAQQALEMAKGKPYRPYPPLSIHDLQAVLALSWALGHEQRGMFHFEEINYDEAIQNIIKTAAHWQGRGLKIDVSKKVIENLGYQGGGMVNGRKLPKRWVVTRQNAQLYKRRVPQLLG